MSENKKKFRIIDASTNPATSSPIWSSCGEESLIIDSKYGGGIYRGNGTNSLTKIISIDENNNLNKTELNIGGFQIKDDLPFNYTFRGNVTCGDYNVDFIAEYDRKEAHYRETYFYDEYSDTYYEYKGYFYTFIITEANSSDEFELPGEDYIGNEFIIPAYLIDSNYSDFYENNYDGKSYVVNLEFTSDNDELPVVLPHSGMMNYSYETYWPITGYISQSVPYSLKRTSKALLNGQPIVTSNILYDEIKLAQNSVKCTYKELKSLRDKGELVPGTFYRITDYVSKFDYSYGNFNSANHPFDIIVLAVDNKTLNENAKAALHDGDTYFANSNLNAWELKYQLDNTPGDYSKNCWWSAPDDRPEIIQSAYSGKLHRSMYLSTDKYEGVLLQPENYQYLGDIQLYTKENIRVEQVNYDEVSFVTAEDPFEKEGEYAYDLVMLVINKNTGVIYDKWYVTNSWGDNDDYYNVEFSTNDNSFDMNHWRNDNIIINGNTYYNWVMYSEDDEYYLQNWVDENLSSVETYDRVDFSGNIGEVYYYIENDVEGEHSIDKILLNWSGDEDIYYQEELYCDNFEDYITFYQSEVLEENSGKGGIYYMKDEFNNEMTLDFKNCLVNGHYVISRINLGEFDESHPDEISYEFEDATTYATTYATSFNKIMPDIKNKNNISGYILLGKNSICRYNDIKSLSGWNYFGKNIINNDFNTLSGLNIFKDVFNRNKILQSISSFYCAGKFLDNNAIYLNNNTCTGDFKNNQIQGDFRDNNITGNFNFNTTKEFKNNTINCTLTKIMSNKDITGCTYNVFGDYFYKNTINGFFNNNRISDFCTENIFGYYNEGISGVISSIIGDSFKYNKIKFLNQANIGSGCFYNMFGIMLRLKMGNYCECNTFANVPNKNYKNIKLEELKDYVENLTFDNNCKSFNLYSTVTTSTNDFIGNITIKDAIKKQGDRFIEIKEINPKHETIITYRTDGELVKYCEADLFNNVIK